MRFKESEIDNAMRLRAAGLTWGPQPGHYVFDINGVVRAGSPFQAGIFLINSANTFEAMAGGQDEMFENFVWLPTLGRLPRVAARKRNVRRACVGRLGRPAWARVLPTVKRCTDLMLKILERSDAGA